MCHVLALFLPHVHQLYLVDKPSYLPANVNELRAQA
jgi:hypothetical protein